MLKYILKRVLLLIPTIFGVLTIVFFMLSLAPGDPARLMLGTRATPESVEDLRKELGLDKPLHEQYIRYLQRMLVLDFGESIKTGDKVINEITAKLPATIELSIVAIIFSTVVGIFVGVISASKQYTFVDNATMIGSLVGVSMPVFWLALVLILIFSVGLDLFPTGGRMDLRLGFSSITNFYILDSFIYLFRDGNPGYLTSALHHIILPAVALGTVPLAIIARVTRSSMLEVLRQDYIRTARSKGLTERKVIYKHALKNALLPVITVIGLEFGYNLAGAVLTEEIFSWNGIGRWIYGSVVARDIPAVQGGIIIISTTFVLMNLLVDILYTLVNPKIKY
ncbi:MAG: ABC transporter permease [Spirochaetota bacterium]